MDAGELLHHLATLDLFVKPPEWEGAARYRRWAFESAALDLALRQAGRALHEMLELEPQPLRFVNSLGWGSSRRSSRCAAGWRALRCALQARRGGDLGARAR